MSDREKLGLALCPFCGGPARFGKCVPGEQELENDGAEYVECCDCGASTCLVFPCMDEAKPRLREMWNTRCRADPVAYLHTVCLDCGNEWVAIWPLNADSLECPKCRGVDTVRDTETGAESNE